MLVAIFHARLESSVCVFENPTELVVSVSLPHAAVQHAHTIITTTVLYLATHARVFRHRDVRDGVKDLRKGDVVEFTLIQKNKGKMSKVEIVMLCGVGIRYLDLKMRWTIPTMFTFIHLTAK